MNLNKVQLIGNVGADPEFHTMQSGGEMVRLSVATTRKWKNKNTGAMEEDTQWHRVVVFAPFLVNLVKDMVKKGTKVYVEGELKTRSYEQDGVKKYTTEINVPQVVGTIIVLANYKERNETHSTPQSSASSSQDFDDDIPF